MNNNGRRPTHNTYNRRRRKAKKRVSFAEILICVLAVVAAVVLAVSLFGNANSHERLNVKGARSTTSAGVSDKSEKPTSSGPTSESGTEEPDVPEIDPMSYTEMTLLVTGDIMYHQPQIDSSLNGATGEYDFSSYYGYIKDIVSAADYSVVNFEATLSGNEYYNYTGYPVFNAPDSAFTTLADAGFDMMLFANNHCYDYGNHGLIRTQQIFDQHGMDYIGARKDTLGKTYKTVDVNGIKLGMLNSTDDLSYGNLANRTINGITIRGGDLELMDIVNLSLLDEFYTQTEARIAELKAEGADLIVYFIHWGNEYQIVHNATQAAIAQKLCDLGVDVIIGGHPHVVQDAEMLTSTLDASHKTLCFYSLGNVVSNQNRLTMGDLYGKEYTENGLIVKLTIRKYAMGDCMVTGVEPIPLWVHRHKDPTTWVMQYDVLPIETALADPDGYGLYESSFGVTHATAALDMTRNTLGGIIDAFAETVVLPTVSDE